MSLNVFDKLTFVPQSASEWRLYRVVDGVDDVNSWLSTDWGSRPTYGGATCRSTKSDGNTPDCIDDQALGGVPTTSRFLPSALAVVASLAQPDSLESLFRMERCTFSGDNHIIVPDEAIASWTVYRASAVNAPLIRIEYRGVGGELYGVRFARRSNTSITWTYSALLQGAWGAVLDSLRDSIRIDPVVVEIPVEREIYIAQDLSPVLEAISSLRHESVRGLNGSNVLAATLGSVIGAGIVSAANSVIGGDNSKGEGPT